MRGNVSGAHRLDRKFGLSECASETVVRISIAMPISNRHGSSSHTLIQINAELAELAHGQAIPKAYRAQSAGGGALSH